MNEKSIYRVIIVTCYIYIYIRGFSCNWKLIFSGKKSYISEKQFNNFNSKLLIWDTYNLFKQKYRCDKFGI